MLKRDEVKREYTWDLEPLYATVEAWEQDFARVGDLIPKLSGYQGKLAQSAGTLLEAIRARDEIHQLLEQVAVYARMRRDENNSNSTYVALNDRVMSLYARVRAAGSYMTPEILAIPTETLNGWLTRDEGLKAYQHELEDLLREKAHVRSAEVEALLAQSSEVAAAPQTIFGMLDNADMRFPKIKDENGNEVDLTKGRFIRFLESPDRRVRADAFTALYDTYSKFRNTLAATHASSVKKDVFYARARNYPSARAMALSGSNIPEAVYDNLVSTVNRNLPNLHRYLQLRRKLLGLSDLHMYDLYVPMVAEANKKVPYDEAVETIMAALKPLGDEYLGVARTGLTSARWVDIYENEGKSSGAYS
ncbi:MAG TPA: M3 family oligoendopeptidase, partial [Symbiobacteriaceae bacterium]|nr:M3 family oligoendopeptidase [Symbiobacteriaceae bacterium]